MTGFYPSMAARRAHGIEGCWNQLLPALAKLYSYAENPDLIDLAIGYIDGIVRNHPFVDGNKRTGFVIGVLFLEINGCRFTAGEEDATRAVLSLAAGTLELAAFAVWLRANVKLQVG